MPIASFHLYKDVYCQMFVAEDQITALLPQGQGIIIPFRIDPSTYEAPALQSWDISYLYAELWVDGEAGPQFVAPALPEFLTESFRPSALRFPLPPQAVSILEEARAGGELKLTVHIQGTFIGSTMLDRVPDQNRRQTLEAWGLDKEIIGPIRSADNVTVRISKIDWEEEILPQWSQDELIGATSSTLVMQRRGVVGQHLDVRALARTLCRATPGSEFEGILEQCRAPIVGL